MMTELKDMAAEEMQTWNNIIDYYVGVVIRKTI